MRGMKGMVGSAGGDPVAKRNTNLSLAESLVAEADKFLASTCPGPASAGWRKRSPKGGRPYGLRRTVRPSPPGTAMSRPMVSRSRASVNCDGRCGYEVLRMTTRSWKHIRPAVI